MQQAATQLLEGFRLIELAAGVPNGLGVEDVQSGMRSAVAFLNEHDIYYSYGLAVGPPTPGVGGFLPQTDQPGLVTSIHQADKNVAVRIDVYAKTAMSLQERPITVDLRLKAAKNSPEEASIRDFLKYGSPLSLPLGTVEADFDGPDLISQPLVDGALRVSPRGDENASKPQLRLVVLDREGEQVTTVLMDREYSTHGTGQGGVVLGLEAALVDPSGCLRLLIRFDMENQSTSMTFAITRPDGILAVDAYQALWAFRSLQRPGHTFMLASRFGPLKGDPLSAPPNEGDHDAVHLWFDVAKSLALLQDHTPIRLYFPENLSEVEDAWIREVCFHGSTPQRSGLG